MEPHLPKADICMHDDDLNECVMNPQPNSHYHPLVARIPQKDK